jgi:hypothetical protein
MRKILGQLSGYLFLKNKPTPYPVLVEDVLK